MGYPMHFSPGDDKQRSNEENTADLKEMCQNQSDLSLGRELPVRCPIAAGETPAIHCIKEQTASSGKIKGLIKNQEGKLDFIFVVDLGSCVGLRVCC